MWARADGLLALTISDFSEQLWFRALPQDSSSCSSILSWPPLNSLLVCVLLRSAQEGGGKQLSLARMTSELEQGLARVELENGPLS